MRAFLFDFTSLSLSGIPYNNSVLEVWPLLVSILEGFPNLVANSNVGLEVVCQGRLARPARRVDVVLDLETHSDV